MIVNLIGDKERTVPEHPNPAAVTALMAWHCKYKTLAGLSAFVNLRTLVIATYPDDDLSPLTALRRLEYLRILHLPKITDLGPLAQLKGLRTLRLETLPSWDSSGKKTIVHSLAPLAQLPKLEHIELFGVVPEDRTLRALENVPSLKSVRVHKYLMREKDRFYGETGLSNSFAPEPAVEGWR